MAGELAGAAMRARCLLIRLALAGIDAQGIDRAGQPALHSGADRCRILRGERLHPAAIEIGIVGVERAFGERLIKPVRPLRDAKTALQEWAQGRGYQTPTYSERGRSGPDHAPLFRVAARISGLPDAEAEGPSKRLAEQAAAEAFLRREGLWSETMEVGNG